MHGTSAGKKKHQQHAPSIFSINCSLAKMEVLIRDWSSGKIFLLLYILTYCWKAREKKRYFVQYKLQSLTSWNVHFLFFPLLNLQLIKGVRPYLYCYLFFLPVIPSKFCFPLYLCLPFVVYSLFHKKYICMQCVLYLNFFTQHIIPWKCSRG